LRLKKVSKRLDRILNGFEIGIAALLLLVIIIKVAETALVISGIPISILNMGFEEILSVGLGFVIGVEFVKMLCKQTSESVVDVLLFTIARQMVVYHGGTFDILLGVTAIAGMFAIKKYLIGIKKDNEQ